VICKEMLRHTKEGRHVICKEMLRHTKEGRHVICKGGYSRDYVMGLGKESHVMCLCKQRGTEII
jgi:hypothetical protein